MVIHINGFFVYEKGRALGDRFKCTRVHLNLSLLNLSLLNLSLLNLSLLNLSLLNLSLLNLSLLNLSLKWHYFLASERFFIQILSL